VALQNMERRSLLHTLSPVVSIQSKYFKGTGVLSLLNEQPHVLTSSHVIFNHEDAAKTIKFKIPKTKFSNFHSTLELETEFTADLVFDDPIADFSFLKVRLDSSNRNTPTLDDFKILEYWAEKSFKINTKSSGLISQLFKDTQLELNEHAILEWVDPFFNSGVIGVDYLQSNKTVLIPVIEPYDIQIEPDTDISGLLQKQIRVPTFAKPGLSGSIIIKNKKIIGLVSKVSLDGSPMVYGITIDEIVQRYQESIKTNPQAINSTSAHWRINKGLFYLDYTDSDGNRIIQPLKSNAEQRIGDPGEGGEPAEGSMLNKNKEEAVDNEAFTLWDEAKLWKFSSIKTTSGLFSLSLMSLTNPFSRKTTHPVTIKYKNFKEPQPLGLMEEVINGQKKFSLPSIMSINSKSALKWNSSSDPSPGSSLIALNSSEYESKTLDLEVSRKTELKKLKPKYVRFSYKLNSDFHCYDGVGNVCTWDNTMAVDLKDRNSLRKKLENQITGFQSPLDSVSINDGLYFQTEDHKNIVGFFKFELHNPTMLLHVQTDFGDHKSSINNCFKENEIFLNKKSFKIANNDSPSILKNFDITISNENLNLITITEKTHDRSNQEEVMKSFSLSKVTNSASNYIRYESRTQGRPDAMAPRVLLVFDPNNLVRLEKIYIDTPLILFEFIYHELNHKNPR
jgi:hypothetical protein